MTRDTFLAILLAAACSGLYIAACVAADRLWPRWRPRP